GFKDFLLLELDKQVGGNSVSGENEVSAYPWAAHYVPLLSEEASSAQELFKELNIITGYENGLPIYNEYYLGADPHERLYMYGRWHEGLVPKLGASDKDNADYQAFFAEMERLKNLVGEDGKRIFAIPVDKGSNSKQYKDLDKISMAEYLQQKGWDSKYLSWYINYCCLDDYGATIEQVSAWAGIHYFAARNGKAANAESGSLVTWPEGNGFIVKQLNKQLSDKIQTDCLVFGVDNTQEGVKIRYFDTKHNKSVEITAKSAIIAVPQFIAKRISANKIDISEFQYSPWAVANITLDTLPYGRGYPLCWDNVVFDSKLLGYVVATHQNINRIQEKTVITYYYPLSHLPPKQAREQAYKTDYKQWQEIFLSELLKIHPELEGKVRNIDIYVWGHGMIIPSVGFIWGEARKKALAQTPPIFHAHSDMSGISIFEEANYRGVKAAESAMQHLNHKFTSSL
ncbi:MAG: FAD-dependent oxidoreductase, partial [Pseudomonadota bacterium]